MRTGEPGCAPTWLSSRDVLGASVGPSAGEDFAHRGARAFLLFHRLFRPRLHVHGHTPLLGANPERRHRTPLGVEVVHAQGYALIAL
mgnify:CR=1 FL=1